LDCLDLIFKICHCEFTALNKSLACTNNVAVKPDQLHTTSLKLVDHRQTMHREAPIEGDPVVMLASALQEAAKGAGIELQVTDKEIFVDGFAAPAAA